MNLCARLAVGNLKRGARSTLPFLLCVIGTVAMFYNLCYLEMYPDQLIVSGDTVLHSLLLFGIIVVSLFALIILYYTNSFLIRRRQKEFGLLNILGLEKRHLARMMAIETLLLAVTGIGLGVGGGILISKALLLLLLKLLGIGPTMGFTISVPAILTCAGVFGAIFLLILAANVRRVVLARPVALLHGSSAGEREPKTRWVLTAVGVLTMGGGYTLSLLTREPLKAIGVFFIAVILVIIGTYCLFTAGSIAILKIVRKKRNYYYQTRHFINISGLIYRMKRNAAGLASICILSTMVLVTISTTVSLYAGVDDILRTQYPRDFVVTVFGASPDEEDSAAKKIDAVLDEYGIARENLICYRFAALAFKNVGGSIDFSSGTDYYEVGYTRFEFIPAASYTMLTGESLTLADGEALLYAPDADYTSDTIDFGGEAFRIVGRLEALSVPRKNAFDVADHYYLIVPDDDAIERIFDATMKDAEYEGSNLYYGFDTSVSDELQHDAQSSIYAALKDLSAGITLVCDQWADFISIYGGLFFVGIVLGTLFLMATVLIIYYKQISEGYDDQKRFDIMKKVGLSNTEVRGTVKSQVLTVFFLPLIAAIVHVAFAFPAVLRMLMVFNLKNIPLLALATAATCIIFALVYAAIYAVTAKSYYRIVNTPSLT
ncbi:MAG: FtsX-like permease family protein [Clostridiaceae bacterium]|nr:FtsX-like permease family protein [Clostridiaceae bacterium]